MVSGPPAEIKIGFPSEENWPERYVGEGCAAGFYSPCLKPLPPMWGIWLNMNFCRYSLWHLVKQGLKTLPGSGDRGKGVHAWFTFASPCMISVPLLLFMGTHRKGTWHRFLLGWLFFMLFLGGFPCLWAASSLTQPGVRRLGGLQRGRSFCRCYLKIEKSHAV